MRYLLFVILVCVTSSHALAFDTKKELAKCAAIEASIARLECFDSLAARMGVDAPKVEPFVGKGKWVVRREISPIDDRTNVYLALNAVRYAPHVCLAAPQYVRSSRFFTS